jgi:S1-C subfamily serine protease
LTEIENKRPGDEVSLTVLRGGHEVVVRIKLGETKD